jgi:hypothetical protein
VSELTSIHPETGSAEAARLLVTAYLPDPAPHGAQRRLAE